MPEGHSVHRIARQFRHNLVGNVVRASSPQGRFSAGAAELDGHTMTDAFAVGKHLFLGFDHGRWLRVHLGIYGAWDFAGELSIDPGIEASNGRYGQTGETRQQARVYDSAGENSVHSIGAPRRTRVRMAEADRTDRLDAQWPPVPIGQVRLRLLTDAVCADLRGPTACEVLDERGVDAVLRRLGPDPLHDSGPDAEQRVVDALGRTRTAIGIALMNQSIVSGIGNVYRAELLFRHRLNPHQPANQVPESTVRAIWRDWCALLPVGVETGQMLTRDGQQGEELSAALRHRDDRHWVYQRAGLPCRVCGTNIVVEELAHRKVYWCPSCQRLPKRTRRT